MPKNKEARHILSREEWPYEVPGNWVWTHCGFLTDICTGKKDANYGSQSGTYLFFTCAATPIRCDNYSFDCKAIILAGNGDLNNISIYEGKFEAYQRTYVVQTSDELNLNYLYYVFKFSWVDYNNDKTFGSTIPYIRLGNLKQYPIPLPPLPEQQRIVARIESLFAKLDAAEGRIKDALEKSERLRASVLHLAFTGELTKKWREDHGVGMESWKHKEFRELGDTRLGKMLDKAKNLGRATQYLRNVNVRWFDFLLDDMPTLLATGEEQEKLSIKDGDLLICEGGEPGRCAVWNQGENAYIYQKALHRFRPSPDNSSHFVAYYLYYMSISGELETHFTGTTIKHLTGKALAVLPVIVPPLPEQQEIVRILATVFDNQKRVKEIVEQNLARIARMKKSLLSLAFRGQLGTNNPAEESMESVLLASS